MFGPPKGRVLGGVKVGPNTYSQGIWKTRVITSKTFQRKPNFDQVLGSCFFSNFQPPFPANLSSHKTPLNTWGETCLSNDNVFQDLPGVEKFFPPKKYDMKLGDGVKCFSFSHLAYLGKIPILTNIFQKERAD